MIKTLLFLLENVPYRSKDVAIAKGYYKFPESWKDFKNYIKLRFNG